MPTATGIINVKFPEDNALNNTRADKKMITKARMIWAWNRNLIQSFKTTKDLPLRLYLIMAAPLTFNIAYMKQNMMALNTVS